MNTLNYSTFVVSDDIALRLCQLEDAEALFSLVDKNRDHLRKWLGWVDKTQTIDDSRDFIRQTTIGFMQGTRYGLGVDYYGELVGMMGLHQTVGEVNLGYWLDEAHQGQGIISTCTHYLTELALRELGVNRIIIRCATDNHRSRAVPERLGYTHEGKARGAQRHGDGYVDIDVYSLIKSDLPITRQQRKQP